MWLGLILAKASKTKSLGLFRASTEKHQRQDFLLNDQHGIWWIENPDHIIAAAMTQPVEYGGPKPSRWIPRGVSALFTLTDQRRP